MIECLSKEHGKRIIKYFESKGFHHNGYVGSNIGCYYGIIDNELVMRKKQNLKRDTTIIVLATT